MSYFYTTRLSTPQAARLISIFEQMRTSPTGYADVYERAKAQGLAVRKQNLLSDFRRYQAIERSLTPETKERAEKWYEKVYEPFRQKYRMTAAQATKALKAIMEGTIETIEEAETAVGYAELYEEKF